MALTVTVDGVNRTSSTKTDQKRKTVTIDMPLGGAWSADVPIFQTTNPPTLLPELLEPIVLDNGSGTTYFSGHVTKRNVTPWGGEDAGALSGLTATAGLAIEQQILVTGTYGRKIRITGCSIANPTVVTTDEAHGFTTGDSVIIADVSGESPTIEGTRTVTVTSTTTFTVPVNVTVAGTGGTVRRNLLVKTFHQILSAEYDFAAFGITLDAGMADGALLEEMRFDRATVRSVWNRMFDATGTITRLTPDNVVESFEAGDKVAGYSLSNANGKALAPVGFEQALGEKVNRAIVRYGGDTQKEVLRYFTGDGSTTAFPLRQTHRANRGYVTVAGANAPLGPGTNWTVADDILTAAVAPGSGVKIEFYFTAQFPGTVTAEDAADIAANGGDPEGVWAKVFDEPDVYDVDAAQQLANGYRDQYTDAPRVIKVSTREAMELPGTEIVLNFPNRGFPNAAYIIQHVRGTDVLAGSMEWIYTCVDFPQRRTKFDDGGVFMGANQGRFNRNSIAGSTQGAPSGQFLGDVVARSGGTDGEVSIGLLQQIGTLSSGYGVRMRAGTSTDWSLIARVDAPSDPLRLQDRTDTTNTHHLTIHKPPGGVATYGIVPVAGATWQLGEDASGKRFTALFIDSITATGLLNVLKLAVASVSLPGTYGNQLLIADNNPTLDFYEADQASGSKFWRWFVNGAQMALQTLTDAYASPFSIFAIDRSGNASLSGSFGIGGGFALTGISSPAQITADQNNYNPSGLATAAAIRLNTDASRAITGIVAQSGGRLINLINVGSFDVTFPHNNASSSAGNRFITPGGVTFTLNPGDGVRIFYDGTDSFWRFIAY